MKKRLRVFAGDALLLETVEADVIAKWKRNATTEIEKIAEVTRKQTTVAVEKQRTLKPAVVTEVKDLIAANRDAAAEARSRVLVDADFDIEMENVTTIHDPTHTSGAPLRTHYDQVDDNYEVP